MKIFVLSSKSYDDVDKDYGDCFIIDNGNEVIVYDCGSEEHAEKVIDYLDERGIEKVDIVLSHNDDDHFKGIPKLIEAGRVNKVRTVLLLKYKDEILDRIDNDIQTRNSISNKIEEIYDNISSLSGYLDDAIDNKDIFQGVKIVGPDKEYLIDTTAKQLDTTESDQIDGTTITNATSVQLSIELGGRKVLLTGDAVFEALPGKLDDYNIIQLSHHGNLNQAEQVFEKLDGKNDIVYIISDNTGSKNAGSDSIYTKQLDKVKGHRIKNTKFEETFEINNESFLLQPTHNLFELWHEIHNSK